MGYCCTECIGELNNPYNTFRFPDRGQVNVRLSSEQTSMKARSFG